VPGWSLAEVLDGAAAAGFTSVGLDNFTLRGHGADDVGRMLRERGLRCSDVGVLPIGTDHVLDVADMLARVIEVTDVPLCIAAFFAPTATADAVRDLDACARILSNVGARLALEFASYGGLTRLADAAALCDAVGWDRCGLLVDTWHFFRTDAPWDLLRSLDGDRIALVHVNDGRAVAGPDLVYEGRFRRLPVGEGSFPLAAFATALADAGFAGTLSTEVLSDRIRLQPPADGARILLTALRSSWPGSLL
jgi:sugar phosphate isomerase/epimerase